MEQKVDVHYCFDRLVGTNIRTGRIDGIAEVFADHDGYSALYDHLINGSQSDLIFGLPDCQLEMRGSLISRIDVDVSSEFVIQRLALRWKPGSHLAISLKSPPADHLTTASQVFE
ncbi:hypothetical protein MesoLjLc_50830 [Mesorhizobium sp. L-8-10]|nr:hypothetical protein MesoLjLc_50830 [Mesorhizobium sp. L-8-10]